MLDTKRLIINVTNDCNMNCKHCYRNHSKEFLKTSDILRFVSRMNCSGKLTNLVISGGEVFLYKELYLLLSEVNEKYNIRINTNGILLNDNIPRLTSISKLRIQVSLDGYDSDTYFSTRNYDDFDLIINNTVRAKEAGLDVIFRTTINRKNIKNYERFIEISKELGIPIIMKPMVNTFLKKQQNLVLTDVEVSEWYSDINQKGYAKYVGKSPFAKNKCPIFYDDEILDSLILESNGKVFLCSLLEHDRYSIGNIVDDLQELEFKKKRISQLIRSMYACKECKECIVRNNSGITACISPCFFMRCEKIRDL